MAQAAPARNLRSNPNADLLFSGGLRMKIDSSRITISIPSNKDRDLFRIGRRIAYKSENVIFLNVKDINDRNHMRFCTLEWDTHESKYALKPGQLGIALVGRERVPKEGIFLNNKDHFFFEGVRIMIIY